MRVIVLVAAVFTACTPESNLRKLDPSLAVAPESLAFGEVGPPLTATLPLYVSNAGSADLDVTVFRLDAPSVFSFVPPEEATEGDEEGVFSFTLDPDGQVEVPVSFAPDTFRGWAGEIVIETNDEEHPRVVVDLSGEGVDLPFPDLQIAPSRTRDVDEVLVGESELLTFEVLNIGDAPLVLTDVALVGDGAFTAQSLPVGATIHPNEARTAVFAYTPVHELGDNALVTVTSNDPDEPVTTVLLLGNGGGPDFEYPVAVIDCPSTVYLAGPDYVTFDGSGSYDPMKQEPLTYAWTVLARPEAADDGIPLDPDDTESIDLYVDVAGVWTVQLVVANAVGTESVPVTCTFDAIPSDALHVELSWDSSQSDLDLHLVQAGGSLFQNPGDCNYCNPNPRWGESGTDDDPRLDIDDRGGFGPENINIFAPADGTYDVFVHYFATHGDTVPSIATVTVWLYGVEVFSGSRPLYGVQGAKDLWSVGTIDIPSGTFAVDLASTGTTSLTQCEN